MLELLAPAGNLDAVIAAVQNGADAVYMGFGDGFNARRSADNFTRESFAKAVRYCHIRGCKVYVTLNTLVGDREMDAAAALAQQASDAGADAILVQDLGLARVLRAALPDIPLHASTQMSIHNLAGVEAAAEMGITRAVLARELSLEQIRFISQHASIETEVFVHGALCFCYSGQCYMSALIGRRSGNRGACAQPCRMQYSMGGRMDEYPLSLRDNCLADYLQQLADAGVACVKIEGRMKRPEYVAVVTDVYARCIHEHRVPTQEENDRLALAFSRQGFTQGYLLGEKGPDMLGTRAAEPDREAEKMFTAARKAYADGERRRVPVKFYAKVQTGEPVMAAVMDEEGHRAVLTGPVPEPAQRAPLTAQSLADQFAKTGGTPYYSTGTESRIDPDLYLPAAAVNDLRRRLITGLKEERAALPERRSLPLLPRPEGKRYFADPRSSCRCIRPSSSRRSLPRCTRRMYMCRSRSSTVIFRVSLRFWSRGRRSRRCCRASSRTIRPRTCTPCSLAPPKTACRKRSSATWAISSSPAARGCACAATLDSMSLTPSRRKCCSRPVS